MSDEQPLFPDLPRQVPLTVQIACIERELAMRQRVYPRWVEQGRLTSEKAADEMVAMEATLSTLRGLLDR